MIIPELHPWNLTTRQARQLQLELAGRVSRINQIGEVRTVAGEDVAVGRFRRDGHSAVVLLSYPELQVLETHTATMQLTMPYIPGLLSFRESPIVLEAMRKLTAPPDILFVDGHGLAHPRRFGIACHLGLLLDIPTIGCAKSLLVGHFEDLGEEAGSVAPLVDRDEVVGAAVRTKTGVNPVFVTIGHKVDLDAAIHWVLACCRGYRLPETTRLADKAAGRPAAT